MVVLQGGKPLVKTIKAGLSDSQSTEVISGLNPGDQVVIGTNDSSGNSTNSSTSQQRTGSQQQRMPMGGGLTGGGRPD